MNTSGRLLAIYPNLMMANVTIFPTERWPGAADFRSWVSPAPKKNWPDFLKRSPPLSVPQIALIVASGRVVADLLDAGLADAEFVPLNIEQAPIRYFAIRPRAKIRMRSEDVSAKYGHPEPVFADAPDYTEYGGHAFVGGIMKRGTERLLCIPEILHLARRKKWTGLFFQGFDEGGHPYECDDRGKVTENTGPRSELIDGYYVSEDVIAADLVRARQLAAELQNSPDTPEWTRRSFEIVRKALAEAPHTLGYPAPAPAKPRRNSRPDAPLLSPTAIKRLKLEGEGEFETEVELGRPLFGSDTLSQTVSDEVVDDDAPEISFSKAELKRRAQAVLETLEGRMPAIDAAIDKLAASHEKSPADFRATLHDPGVFLCTADMAKGERWAFVVEDDLVSHFFEFDGDTVIEVWSGD